MPAKRVNANTTRASVRIGRKKLFISYSLIGSVFISKLREFCGRIPRPSAQGHHESLPMNILRERKRSKVFKRKCFYLNYEANGRSSGPTSCRRSQTGLPHATCHSLLPWGSGKLQD